MKELPKKYNIAEREEHWRKYWEKNDVYKFDEKSKKPVYSVDTPPPYVSAEHLHTGHIMSYSQAEFVVRYKRMKGFNVYYPMGFDDNGLPTERYVEKKHNIDKSKITRKEFISKCLEETRIGAENYRDLWRSLGISVDWSKTYSTIDKHSQKIAQWSFLDLYKKGKIYRAKKPVLWCTSCRTAISQADLEADERKSKLNYIKAKVESGEELIFATTRPELLPACMGISVHPNDKRYKKLIGKKVILPLTKAHVYLSEDETIDPKYGSGVVYYCSFGGQDCIEWLSRHPEARPIHALDPDGRLNELAGKYKGLKISEAREKIIEDLKKDASLVKQEDLKNVTFAHERCGTDVEYISTEQWFIEILSSKKDFEKRGKELNWYPTEMSKIYKNWVTALKWDWCISRQRYYGVPFPLWYCEECNEIILANEKDLPVDPTLDKPKKSCPKCKNDRFEPEADVMDTWMTSSLTPELGYSLAKHSKFKKGYTESLRPQAFEIIRTWLFYTVVKSHYHFNKLPFENVMISGHGLDEKGRKISKRLGNYVAPHDILKQYGADAMRYWATGATLGGNIRWNEEEVKKGKKTVTKLWNASRFVIGFIGNQKIINKVELEDADKWLLHKLNETVRESTKHFDNYEYSKARDAVDNFFWKNFTDYYMEFVKYRVYGDSKKSKDAAFYTLYHALLGILKLYAPILPFITEEIYQLYFKKIEKGNSIHATKWPKFNKKWTLSKKAVDEFRKLIKIADQIRAYKTKNEISLGKEIEKFKTKEKLSKKQREFLSATQKVKKVLSK